MTRNSILELFNPNGLEATLPAAYTRAMYEMLNRFSELPSLHLEIENRHIRPETSARPPWLRLPIGSRKCAQVTCYGRKGRNP